MKKRRRQIIINDNTNFNNNYNRQSYKIGTRITKAQVAHRVGYFDDKSGIIFYDQVLDHDAWLWLVDRVKGALNLSPRDAAVYVNNVHKTKLKDKSNYTQFVVILQNTCGKLFSVVPSVLTQGV